MILHASCLRIHVPCMSVFMVKSLLFFHACYNDTLDEEALGDEEQDQWQDHCHKRCGLN